MANDDMVTKQSKGLAAMLLTEFDQYIPISTPGAPFTNMV